ncbi:MAG: Hypothetical protein C75L2_00100018 [Leptospirillum sp. Group II 'C75']|uniref:hypothetical protein n=1 Tax=Leptospirillum sp. Group II 'CF-1' TaxID=1660083 RepID=UPI0000F0C6CA|nr:hypothetical protein [Leptospirillum sp. Group II 'CF-1']AKS22584.1 hypothetical protein ABH19_00675 [Leptospirillum sp. Group II 'CF-1']EAY57902.1 MAG: hypothetical protein UBAL2_82410304 [Leptospirillum rubarum]EIJ75935.1 MAG: Hypothetical protein C75L2_00100018 [Leptospirillum sp. Group II 'C75']
MILPFRTRMTIFIVALPGILDMFWILERFLGLPPGLRHAGMIVPEILLLGALVALVMWSFVVRWLHRKETVILLGVALAMAAGGISRLLWIVWSPLGDPLLKPHLFEAGGLVTGALILGIEAESGRRYFLRMEEKSRSVSASVSTREKSGKPSPPGRSG